MGRPVEYWQRNYHQRQLNASGVLDNLDIDGAAHLAIFALFQPGGLSESTFGTLRHLVQKGYATVVVSNAPLSDHDRARLEQNAVFVHERPNFGYDFGAFQEIITALSAKVVKLKSLVLINDSVWFPIQANARLLDEMQIHPASAVSAQKFEPKSSKRKAGGFSGPILGSYLIMFKQDVLQHDVFRHFWQSYRMSSNKELTIRRGERGLSKALHDAGLSCGGVYSVERFEAALADMSIEQLRDSIEGTILLKPRDQEKRSALLDIDHFDDRWVSGARAFLLEMAWRKNITSVHPVLCIDRLGVEIFKKNDEMHYRVARHALSQRFRERRNEALTEVFQKELAATTEYDFLPKDVHNATYRPAHEIEQQCERFLKDKVVGRTLGEVS